MDDDDSFLLVINPQAGSGRAGRHRDEIERALRGAGVGRFETALTGGPGDATRIVRDALRGGVGGIAAVGGDGTMNEVVNGFIDEEGAPLPTEAWFGPLPFATGGDFCRGLGVPRGPRAMAEHLAARRPRPIDVGWIRYLDHEGREAQRAFVNIASFGMGGLVDLFTEAGPKWLGGRLAFLVATLRAMARYRQPEVRVRVDERSPRTVKIVNVAVANGRFFGGGMQIAARAELDDGLFDIVSAESMSVPRQVALLPALYRGAVEGRAGVHCSRGQIVHAETLDSTVPVYLDVDGEPLGKLPATFSVLPGAVLLRA